MPSTAAQIDTPNLPKVLTSVKDLPKGGSLISLETPSIDLGAVRTDLAVWALPSNSQSLAGRPVWLIVSEDLMGSLLYHQYRQTIIKAGFKIPHVIKTTRELLAAIYEQKHASVEEAATAQSNNEIINYYQEMIVYSLKEQISDIHIEVRARSAVIRMRKHGQLRVWREISSTFARSLVTVIHNVLAENKDVVLMEDECQAAAVNTFASNIEVKLRYQSLPVYPGGFDVVMRVLPLGADDEKVVSMEDLGYARSQMRTLLDIVAKPVGALIIAGTTGSGKSTTLKNLLMFVNAARNYQCKIFTIEDPPEYRIPKVSQIPVVRRKKDKDDPKAVSPFLEPLTATMRADPDILMIGEVRDNYTGDGMKKANQSGHQVMTTVHASSALGIMNRLVDFGISPNVLGSPEFINGLIYQKLLPTLCQKCSVRLIEKISAAEVNEETLELAKRLRRAFESQSRPLDSILENVRLRGPGCRDCGNMGVNGRTVCAEIIAPDFEMLKHFREGHDVEAYKYWRNLSDGDLLSGNMNGKTVLEHALMKVYEGIASPEDVEVLMGPVDGANRLLTQMLNDDAKNEINPVSLT